jgi:hypothetical protein
MTIPLDFVAHYTMDNISGSTMVDETGNYNGTITGAVQAPGHVLRALSFDGTTGNKASISNLFSGWATDFTISLWVDATLRVNTYDAAFMHDPLVGGGNRFRLYDFTGGGSDWFNFAVGSTTISATKPAAGFRNIIISYDRTTGEMTYDIDDVSQGTATAAANITFDAGETLIGCVPAGYTGGAVSILGAIDQIRVYDRILTPAEKTSLATEPYQYFGITGVITESLPATDFFVRASQLDTGAFIGDAVVQGDNTYAFDFGAIPGYETYADEVLLTALPKTGKRRLNSTAYSVGDYYLPADVTTNDHIYEVTVAGTTAASEPTLDQAGGTTVDGTVTVQDRGVCPTPQTQIDYATNI